VSGFRERGGAARKLRREARVALLAGRELTAEQRRGAGGEPHLFQVLYLAHCMREKGLFDAIAGVQLANQILAAQGSPVSMRFAGGGHFHDPGGESGV